MNISQHFYTWQADFFSWLPDVWHFQVFVIDNKPITLGKLSTGIVLLFIGYFLCRSISRQISSKILSRLDIDESLRHTLQMMSFYILLIVLTLFILRLLNVPITIFTVLGGALAIGVGFGSQTIVANFISGLIIMLERPVRVGDFVDVGGLTGKVEHIGARSTRIKSLNNTHILVPNSTFLENNVVNWTLSDYIVRTKVSVGVAYGSPTRLVEKLLMQAVEEEREALGEPKPGVFFSGFGDSALEFQVFFWVRFRNLIQMRRVESELRYRIDDLFQENKIVIAFPQRDVHLDSLSPIQVQVVEKSGGPSA